MTGAEYAAMSAYAAQYQQYLQWVTSQQVAQGVANYVQMTGGGQILTTSGQLVQVSQTAGELVSVSQPAAQLITQATAAESGVTVAVGDVAGVGAVDAGASLGAVSLGTVASAACAVFGGVVAGVNLYQSNPDFWTALSQTLLPFAYENPTEGGWDNVWDALFPVAVDSSGKTMIPKEALEAVYQFFAHNVPVSDLPYVPSDNPLNIPSFQFVQANSFTVIRGSTGRAFTFNVTSGGPVRSMAYKTATNGINVISATATPDTVLSRVSPSTDYVLSAKYTYDGKTVYYITVMSESSEGSSAGWYENSYNSEFNSNVVGVAWLMIYGSESPEIPIEGFSWQDGATVPDLAQTLEEQYPSWLTRNYFNVEPDPEQEGQVVITPQPWLPLALPELEPSPESFTVTMTQQDAQAGTNPLADQQAQLQPLPTQLFDNANALDNPTGNTGITPGPVIPLNGAMTGIFHVYHPTLAQLQALNSYLWDQDITKLIVEIFNNNPVDAIIGLQSIYVTPHDGGTASIKLGYMDSGVVSAYVDQQFVTINCGSVGVPEHFQTAYDYDPYTKVYAYLPFIGVVPLSSYDIVGATVSIEYTVDILTGVCCAKIYTQKGPNQNNVLLYTFDGSCASELPVTAASRANQMLATVRGAVGGAVTGAMAGGVYGAIAGGLVGGISGASRGADITMGGRLSGIAGACAPRKPYIIVKRTIPANAYEYRKIYGEPANYTVRLGVLSGYTRIKSIHVDDVTGATQEEKEMILQTLREGVII